MYCIIIWQPLQSKLLIYPSLYSFRKMSFKYYDQQMTRALCVGPDCLTLTDKGNNDRNQKRKDNGLNDCVLSNNVGKANILLSRRERNTCKENKQINESGQQEKERMLDSMFDSPEHTLDNRQNHA